MNDYILRNTARRIIDSPRNREQMLAMLDAVPSEDVQPETYDLTTNIENVLSLLNGINSSGRMDYGDYCALYDAIEVLLPI